MTEISVITLANGRPDHLRNLVLGLNNQTQPPKELIVTVMQDRLYDLPDTVFPVRQQMMSGKQLPLAAARNAGARAASGNALVFLDMDCIPAVTLISDYGAALHELDGLIMGEVLYLPGGAVEGGWQYSNFAARAVRHSDRGPPPAHGTARCTDYRCFWSLNFAMRRTTFLSAGGFDERYVGYGGEDTDFSKSIDRQGIPIAWLKGALVYHQYHPHHMPPVHHIESVVRNAQLFEEKWGYRTMGHWLHAFRLMGLIDDTPGMAIRILRKPGPQDLLLTSQQSHRPYANTAEIIRILEARAGQEKRAAA